MVDATDSSADESLEVERPADATPWKPRAQATGRDEADDPGNNGEKAKTAVARAERPTNAPDEKPRPGHTGQGGKSGTRHEGTVDAAQLLTREKLRRVERHWERSKRNDDEPRRSSECAPPGTPEPDDKVGETTPTERTLGSEPQAPANRDPSPRLGGRRGQATPNDSKDRKHGEPHDRQQGATNLQSARWSKPSKSGGTTRAERTRDLARPGRRWLRVATQNPSGRSRPTALRSSGTTGSGHQAPKSMEGRISDNPMRGVRRPNGRETRRRKTRRIAHHGRRAAQAGLSLRRRCEDHEGRAVWSTRPQGAREREVPRSSASTSKKRS